MINFLIASTTMFRSPQLSFLGGGVAAHVYALVAAEVWPSELSDVTMIDPLAAAPDRTLCVWGAPLPALQPAIVAEWSSLRFGYKTETFTCELGDWTYRQYTAASIREHANSKLTIRRIVGSASDPITEDVLTLDSRPAPPVEHQATVSLLQHFRGRRIRTSVPTFTPDTAVMMDFRTDQRDGVCFVYVLPYSEYEALVECTAFTEEPWFAAAYDRRLDAYIDEIIGCTTYDVIATEEGIIPMNDHRARRWRGPNWITIGGVAGLTKPTTGYTVARCARDADVMFRQLRETGVAAVPASPPKRFAWYDVLLLRIIRDEPQVVPRILWTLFRRNPIRRILRFLDEQTSLREEIALFWTLPWMPFLRAIVRR